MRQKLLLLLLVISLPAGGIIAASGSSQRQDQIVQTQNAALPAAQNLAARQERLTLTTQTIPGLLAQLPEGQRLAGPARKLIFQERPARPPFPSIILASTPEGHRFAASSPFEAGLDLKEGARLIEKKISDFKSICLRENGSPYWSIGSGLPKGKIFQEAYLKMWANLSLLGLAALLALALLWILKERLSGRPINRLAVATPRFGMGGLDTRSGLAQTSDELGRLAHSCDNLAGQPEKKDLEGRQTERALGRAQELPWGSEERFRSLVENIDLGIALIDSDYRVIMSNPAQGDHFRKQTSEIIGKECFREFEKREAVCPHCPGTVAMATGQKAEAETQGCRDDGSRFAVRIQAFPQFGPDGQISGFIEVVEDITQRKQVEKALETERLILRDILEATLAGYWDWDIPNNQEYLSPTFKKMFGYEDHELPNSPETWQRLIFPEDLPGVLEIFKKHVESRGVVPYYNEVRYRHKDGSTIWVICAGRVIEWDAAGQPRRMVGCHVDITERQRAESSLADQFQFLQLLIDTIPIPIFYKDLNGVYLGCNQSLADFLGRPKEEIIGKTVLETYTKEQAQKFQQMDQELFRHPGTQIYDFVMGRPDGTLREFIFTKATFADPSGKVAGLIGVMTDITERNRAEEALRDSEEKYRAIVAGFDGLIYTCSQDYHIEFMNDKFISRTGYDATGELCYKALHERDSICPWCVNEQVFKGETVRWEVKSPKDNRWYYIVSVPIYRADGTISKQSMIQDTTERKRAEESLRQSEQKFRLLYDNAPLGYQSLDEDGQIIEVNQTWLDILGYEREEVIGKWIGNFLTPEYVDHFCQKFPRFKEVGEICDIPFDMVRRDGTVIAASFNGKIAYDARNRFLRTHCMFQDITARKQAEAALRQAHETLRATLDAAPVAILDLDKEGRVKSLWNPAAEKMLGWRRDEVLGHFLPSIPENSQEEFARFRQWVRSGRSIMGKDVVRRRKDGSPIEYSIYAAPEYDDRGQVRGKIAVLVDITERKRAEEAIKLNEARLAGLLRISQYQAESIQDLLNYALEEAIALTASKMGFIYLYDDPSQQLTLNTWSSEERWEGAMAEPHTIYQLEDIGLWGEAVRQARPMVVNDFLGSHPLQEGYPAGQTPHKFLTIPVFANQRIVAVVGVANKAADYDEADVLQLTLMMDAVWKIVERRQALEELQAAAQKWQTTFDAITDVVFLLDPAGTILQCNQALADLVQKPFADILGRRCCEVVHSTYKSIPGCPMERMRQTRQREIMLLPRGDRWFNLGVDPILDEAGNLVGAVHIMSDVTQLMETERSLYRRTQDLTMMNAIGSIMSRSLDLRKVLGGSLRMIQQNMFAGKSRAIIFLLDEATGELRAAGQQGFPEDHPCLGRPLQAGQCLCGRAALSGKIVFSWRGCADCASGFPMLDTAPRQDIGLPLKVRTRLLGVMHLSLSPDQKVNERHLKLLEAIADQISLAVEKARLFEQVNLQGTQLRTLSARLAELEEAERKVLARELHDQVGQSLTTLSLYLTMLQEQLPRMMPEKAQSRITDALTLVEETADSVREIMAELRPPVLDDFGLMAAARWFGKQFSQRTGISLQAIGEDPEPRLDRKVEMGLFRILQEALNNVAKHARASQVTVTEEVLADGVRLTIADNGVGFDVTQVGRPKGRHRWGLMNMSERALAAGGTCRIDSQPGHGTRVIVEVNR